MPVPVPVLMPVLMPVPVLVPVLVQLHENASAQQQHFTQGTGAAKGTLDEVPSCA
jgi:hypothetical protein